MNSPAFIPTEAIAALIQRIREYAEAYDQQWLLIRCQLRTALEAIERPEVRVLPLPDLRGPEHNGGLDDDAPRSNRGMAAMRDASPGKANCRRRAD